MTLKNLHMELQPEYLLSYHSSESTFTENLLSLLFIAHCVKRWNKWHCSSSYAEITSPLIMLFLIDVCINTKHTQTWITTSVHRSTWSHTHTKWPYCRAISSSTPLWVSSDVSLIFFSPSVFTFPASTGNDRWMERRGEQERDRGKGGGGCFLLSVFLSFLFESKLNLNSALPYADLQRNVPYAQKCIEQYQRQTQNETKY